MRTVPFLAPLAFALAASVVVLAPSPVAAQEASTSRVISLAQVERSALEQQPQVLVARAATSVAQAQADQARAPLLPQVTGTAGYTRQTGNFVPRPGAIPNASGGPSGWIFPVVRLLERRARGFAAPL